MNARNAAKPKAMAGSKRLARVTALRKFAFESDARPRRDQGRAAAKGRR